MISYTFKKRYFYLFLRLIASFYSCSLFVLIPLNSHLMQCLLEMKYNILVNVYHMMTYECYIFKKKTLKNRTIHRHRIYIIYL